MCNLCNDNVIEDEIHFLLCCDFYSDIRRPLLAKAQLCNGDFQNMSLNDKFIFIMSFVNKQYILASTLHKCLIGENVCSDKVCNMINFIVFSRLRS